MSNLFSGVKNGKKFIKRFFLVDFENVQSHGLLGLSKLKETDAVTVYFSKNADTISFEIHMALNSCRAKMDFVKVGTGVKNALDFQLSSQLGYIINQNIVAGNKNVVYYIVSMDNGFSVLKEFWEQFGADVRLVHSINYAVDPPRDGEYSSALSALGLTEEEEAAVVEALRTADSNTDLHNTLQATFKDSNRASEVYRAVKPTFSKAHA